MSGGRRQPPLRARRRAWTVERQTPGRNGGGHVRRAPDERALRGDALALRDVDGADQRPAVAVGEPAPRGRLRKADDGGARGAVLLVGAHGVPLLHGRGAARGGGRSPGARGVGVGR
jgi:hypothetical protein